MKTKTVATAGTLGVIAVAFAFGLRNVFRLRDMETVITISKHGGRCVAVTRDRRLEGYRWKTVSWKIVDSSPPCLPPGAEVELRFEGDDSPFLTSKPKDRTEIKRRVVPWARVKKSDSYRPYRYKVWAVNGGTNYEMEDPELEIVF